MCLLFYSLAIYHSDYGWQLILTCFVYNMEFYQNVKSYIKVLNTCTIISSKDYTVNAKLDLMI